MSLALALSACGGGESNEAQIISAIETSATSTDPADCEALATLGFMEQTEFEEGQDAQKACEDEAEDGSNNPDSVTVTNVNVSVNGSSATADAAFDGGNLDQQTVTVGLVEEGGAWKLDELQRFVVFDREPLLESIREDISEEAGGEGEELEVCLVEELEEASDEKFEEAVLSLDAFVALAEGCF